MTVTCNRCGTVYASKPTAQFLTGTNGTGVQNVSGSSSCLICGCGADGIR